MRMLKDTIQNIALEIKTGKTPPTSNPEYFGEDVDWYTPSDLDKEKYLGKSRRGITDKAIVEKKAIVFRPHTVLIGAIGDIGKLGITSNISSSNQQITGIYPNPDKVDAQYLYYWLKAHKNLLIDKAKSAIVPILNNKDLGQIKVSFPEKLSDQLHIANILSKAENLIAQRKESIRLLDEFLKSTFLEMFGDPVRNEKAWHIGKFKDLATLDRKQVLPSEFTNEDFYIGLEDIEKETGNIIKTSSENTGDLKSSKFRFTTNHILYAKLRPYLNKVALPTKAGICSTDIFPVLPLEEKSNRFFICYLMRSKPFVTEMHSKSSGANLPRASASVIENFKTYQPPIELQSQFAQIVEKTEALKSQYQQSLQELENLYGSLSQKAFRGELTINKAVSV